MHDVRIGRYGGYSGIGDWLKGPDCKQLMRTKTNEALMIWQAFVAKQSGELARTGKARVAMSGDRWVGTVTIGAGVDYAASHEFGHDNPGSTKHYDGFDELRETLKNLDD